MWLPLLLAVSSASADDPAVACTMQDHRIIVRFSGEFLYAEVDKFAIVQAGTLKGGEWLYVVYPNDPPSHPPIRFSPWRPGTRRLLIDTRRQLAVRYGYRTGKASIVHAFPRPGRYRLVFSDNLDTELDNMTFLDCPVRVR